MSLKKIVISMIKPLNIIIRVTKYNYQVTYSNLIIKLFYRVEVTWLPNF